MSEKNRNHLPPRLLIVANAGSGKTYELVTRCIKLISLKQAPEEILALTFTRKAAAEFLQKLFERLGDAAESDEKRSTLAADLGLNNIPREECILWMHQLLAALPKLSMGTMDQFFGRIVRSFPFELGIGRDFDLLDDAAQEENLQRTLEHLFQDAAKDDVGLSELVELLRQNSLARSHASVLGGLQSSVSEMHSQIAGPSKNVPWGDAKRIWPPPKSCAFLSAPPLAEAAQAFSDEVEQTSGGDLAPKLEDYLRDIVLFAKSRAPRAGLGTKLAKLVEYLGKEWKFVRKYNSAALRFGNFGYLLDGGELRRVCRELHDALIGAELRSRLVSSAALYDLLRRYEAIYQQTIRSTGALTFADMMEILTGQSGRLKDAVAYRLDSRHKHWLLDEFQDTSRAQWGVIEPLVSEVLMDTSDERTFFFVGDTKQSIYGWRGGDDRLFREIFNYYNRHSPKHIAEEKLGLSYRSDQAVIEVVNAVFNDVQVSAQASPFQIPLAAVERWKSGWVTHQWREEAGPGYVRLHDLALASPLDEKELIDRELVRLVRDEVQPLQRGLSCAVLTRSGKMAEHYAKVLQNSGIKAITEGKFAACKANPESLALMAAVRLVASPTDRIAEQFFLASPFGCLLEGATEKEKFSRFRADALRHAAESGFAATLGGWVERAGSAVTSAQVTALLDAAAEFEASRSVSDGWRTLINYLEHYRLQENEAPGAVRVMTIHQAKGLGMDVVILPELGGAKSLSQSRPNGISLVRDDAGKVLWGLNFPPSEICNADPELKTAREGLKSDHAFNELCVFYVAMTRAKHAVYCLTAETKKIKNAARWLIETFPAGTEADPIRQVGDKEWFSKITKDPPENPKVIYGHRIDQATRSEVEAIPSSHEGEAISAEWILEGGAARYLGTEVHQMLAQVEWLGDLPDFGQSSTGAISLVEAFLDSPRADVLRKPDGLVLLWRERAFDVEVDGLPLSGVFDRVHVLLDGAGTPTAAHIYDFKTDKGSVDLNEKYQDQLAAYTKAAAILLGLDTGKVSAVAMGVRVAQ